jgi:hypothetical protein
LRVVRDSKGSIAILPGMSTNRRLPVDRDRAVARLRRVTVGTAAAGMIGTALFGTLAAATYDGTNAAATSDAVTDITAAQVAVDDTSDSSTTTGTDDQLVATPAPTTASSGAAHASTGGS